MDLHFTILLLKTVEAGKFSSFAVVGYIDFLNMFVFKQQVREADNNIISTDQLDPILFDSPLLILLYPSFHRNNALALIQKGYQV